MTIISAEYANEERTCVTLQTAESGAVCIQLPPFPDVSSGWRPVYYTWLEDGNETGEYVPPPEPTEE